MWQVLENAHFRQNTNPHITVKNPFQLLVPVNMSEPRLIKEMKTYAATVSLWLKTFRFRDCWILETRPVIHL